MLEKAGLLKDNEVGITGAWIDLSRAASKELELTLTSLRVLISQLCRTG